MKTLALVLAIIMFLIGLIGTILPALPGVLLIFGGMLVYGFMTGFASLSIWFFVMQLLVMAVIFIVDFIASVVSTKKYGGSKQAAFGAAVGTILGVIILGPLGIIIGPFAGSVAAEVLLGKEIKQAVKVGFGSLVGVMGGTLFKLAAEALMIIYFFMSI
ncbi:MAG TPA: DUF456 domain-containing protein [Sedimentibacter sp.]|nr:DUF456 domain-containing protein [Sedimentibacter sp.]HOW23754.1 DUF456 domain-containing protein [Sedimentibacter sp.]HRC79872.1 DUF456 domain-containing protein [Sedimentibacter sp.]